MVEWTGLENRQRRKAFVSSNLTASASWFDHKPFREVGSKDPTKNPSNGKCLVPPGLSVVPDYPVTRAHISCYGLQFMNRFV